MTIQTGPGSFKETVVKTDTGYSYEEEYEINLAPEKGSAVNRVGKKGFQ